jgi:hypothetical protein
MEFKLDYMNTRLAIELAPMIYINNLFSTGNYRLPFANGNTTGILMGDGGLST